MQSKTFTFQSPDGPEIFVYQWALDPAGGHTASVDLLVERYRAKGLQEISLRYYPQARHEIPNETNRDEVQCDLLNWMEAVLAR